MTYKTSLGDQYYSISISGLAIFQQGELSTGVGSMVIDLASASIPPGEYTLSIRTGMGSVEIYLPNYVQITVDGSSVFGSKNIHEGLDWWKILSVKFQHLFKLPNEIPEHAVAPVSVEQPVLIHFFINTGMGGIDIYRLGTGQ